MVEGDDGIDENMGIDDIFTPDWDSKFDFFLIWLYDPHS